MSCSSRPASTARISRAPCSYSYRIVQLIGARIVPADADVAGLEHLAQLVADQIDDRLEIELRGHPLLDAVDHRELGGALLGFLQQALRFVEQARVLQRDAHARRRPCVSRRTLGFAERVLALVILER